MGRSEACGEAPAQFFSEDEFLDARVFWTVPIILGWDAFLIPETRTISFLTVMMR